MPMVILYATMVIPVAITAWYIFIGSKEYSWSLVLKVSLIPCDFKLGLWP